MPVPGSFPGPSRALLVACLAILPAASAQDASPLKSGIIPDHVDPSIRIQDDLFRHVNGKWLKESPIPPDRPSDGAFYALRDQSEASLKTIIEELAAQKHAQGTEAQKIADLFKSFMNEARAEELGITPIADELEAVARIQNPADLLKTMGTLRARAVPAPFAGFVGQDAKDSEKMIMYFSQAGIGLPDEAYYRLPNFEPVRKAYLAHIQKMFELAGFDDPAGRARRVFDLETAIAKNHWDRVKSRDRTLSYNKLDRAALDQLTPGLDWNAYFAAIGLPDGLSEVVVRQPSYLAAMAELLQNSPIEDWKDALRWNLLRSHAPLLNKALVDENFNFYGKTLTGQPEQRPRWKRGVAAVESALGEAVGKLYVERHFPPAAKERMKVLVNNLIEAYRQSIASLDWMSQETKSRALDKLDKFTPKIGYPDKWRDYSSLEIQPDDLVGNVQRAAAFELKRNLDKLGKPVDRTEWGMTPQTVNAYYNPSMNEIVFPAAILQPPFFDLNADDAVNYGGIGAVIGHEIGHGFDDQGSKSDGAGNLVNWWTDSDRKEFEARTRQLIDQYSAYEPAQFAGQNLKVNGALTIGENIGDLGGLSIALKAYRIAAAGQPAPVLDGLTGDQRFFIGWAQVWRVKFRDAELRQRLATDPHSPGEFRCNGVVRNIPDFYEAFGVKPGDQLFLPPEQRVKIW
jgi:putative endopeptidase